MEVSALNSLIPLLECPTCRAPGGRLEQRGESLACAGCAARFPVLAGAGQALPWLFADPEASLLEWKSRFNGFLVVNDAERRALDSAGRTGSAELGPLARQRIERLLRAKNDQRRRVVSLLEPLGLESARFENLGEPSRLLRAKLPRSQGLVSYYSNALRDWAWDTPENDAALEAVDAVLAPLPAAGDGTGRLLTLGAGACRLSYDLHRRLAPELSVALDHNPLLLLLAQRVIAGESVDLYEFPVAPLDIEHGAVLRRCAAPEPLERDFACLFADALNAPFAPGAFDAVLTPWLIDIIPENLGRFASRVNRLLAEGGIWLNTGSLAFFHRDEAWCHGLEELPSVLERGGFEVVALERRSLPYLQSPASGPGRIESVVSFSARKLRNVPAPAPHHSLPDWILDTGKAIPSSDALSVACSTHWLTAQVLGAVDGRRSIEDVGAAVARSLDTPLPVAVQAVRRILTEIFESELRNKGSFSGGLE
jgi:hypothetical protein